ncbi:xylulokinase [Labrys wisconsinensis]|uniref:Xylulokinase n=1 Tax=Labrys wisconsinensis TaxID=425677 RepID=A0ABU0JDW5_9HYPH|nr:FGGY family carbohydrate kinase [Labrys wisconsinensis]MDQ0472477.1 xylulokinase [Labrys wisconsinensis]
MPGDLVVGLDSSTSATKAIAWDRRGRLVAQGRAPIPLANPQPGYFEQDPADWWSSSAAALRELTGQVDPARIAAVGISNQRETFGVFSRDGTALRPGMVWLDDRARPQQRRFGETFGAERVHAISGKPLDVIPCLYRFIWLAESEPDLFARAERIADVHGYLAFRLTGAWVTSLASADPMGAVDMASGTWSSELLAAAGVDPGKMPALVAPGEPMGTVTTAAAAVTGLAAGTPVIAGGGDGQCAGTGAGLIAPGAAYVNLGTAVVSGSFGAAYAYHRAFRTMNAVADGGFIYETCLRSGTFLVDWLAREVFLVEPGRQRDFFAALEAEAAASPIGAGGVVLVPYWQGCMTPHWDSFARGVIAGLSGSTRRGDLYRALLEGIAMEQAATTNDAAAATGVPISSYIAIGGGASSDLWAQILADAAARPVRRSETVEASSLGAAMAAARGAGWFASIAEATAAMAGRPVRTFEPDPRRSARYAELLAIHADLWPTLSAWNARLAAFTEAGSADTEAGHG